MANISSQIIFDTIIQNSEYTGTGPVVFDVPISFQDASLFVLVGQNGQESGTIVTYNGVALTKIVTTGGGGGPATSGIWYLRTPPVGTYTLSVTGGTTANFLGVTAIVVLGAAKNNNNNFITSTNTYSATANNISLTIRPQIAGSVILETSTFSYGTLPTDMEPLTAEQTTITSEAFSGNAGPITSAALNVSYSLATGNSLRTMGWSVSPNTSASSGSIIALVIPPAHAPSVWFPSIDLRNTFDTNQQQAAGNVGTPFPVVTGHKPTTFWKNSFLHSIGRIFPWPPPVPLNINVFDSSAVTESLTVDAWAQLAEIESFTSQIVIDKVVQGQSGSGAPLTLDIPIPSPDVVLVVTGGSSAGGGGPWTSVTYNGVSLTNIVQKNSGAGDAEIWWLPNPPVGVYPLTVTPQAGSGQAYVNAMVLLGVDKKDSNLISGSASITNVSGLIDISVTLTPDAPGSLVIDTMAIESGSSFIATPDQSQTQIFNPLTINSNENVESTYKIASNSPTTMFYDLHSNPNAAMVAVAFRPATAPSIWFPNIDERTLNDTVITSGLDQSRTPKTGNYGYKPSNFFRNSFLHTIGRGPALAPVQTLYTLSVSDSSTVTESLTMEVIDFVSVFDSSAVTELVTVEIVNFISVSDSSAVTDVVTQVLKIDNVNVFDSSAVTESVTMLEIDNVSVFDSSTVTESITVVPGIIVFDNTSSSGYEASLSTYSWSHTATGNHLGIIVGISIFAAGTVSSVTYNGVNLTFVRADTNGIYRSEIWELEGIPAGTNTIQVNLSTSLTSIANAISYQNVDQINQIVTSTGSNNVGNPATVNISTTEQNAWVVDNIATKTTGIAPTGTNQRQRANNTGALGTGGMSDEGTFLSPTTATMSWGTIGALDSWAQSVIALRPYGDIDVVVFDSSAVTESVTVRIIDFVNVFDSSTVTESVTMELVDMDVVFDSSAVTENVTVEIIDLVSVFDSSAVTESVTVVIPIIPEIVFDASAVTESITIEIIDFVNVFDSSAVTEAVTVQIANTISVSDSSTVTDVLTQVELIDMDQIFDSSTVTESVTLEIIDFVNVFDSSTVTEFVTIEIVDPLVISDSSTVTDVVTQVLITDSVNIFDSSAVTESITVRIIDLVSVFDASAVTESVTVAAPLAGISVFDSSAVTENVTIEIVDLVSVFDSSAVTESVSVTVPVQVSVFDSSSITESLTVEIVNLISVGDDSVVTEAVTMQITDFEVIFDSSVVTDVPIVEIVDFILVSDSSTVTDVVSQVLVTDNVSVFDSSTVTESVSIYIPILYISVEDDSAVTDVVVLEQQDLEVIFDSSTVTESVQVTLTNLISVGEDSAVTENVSVVLGQRTIVVGEDSAVTEFVQVEIIDFETIFDSSTVTEFSQVQIIDLISVSDSSTVTDVLTKTLTISFVSVFDSSTVVDVLTGQNGGIYLNPIDITVFDRVGRDAVIILVEGRLAYLVVEGAIPYYVYI